MFKNKPARLHPKLTNYQQDGTGRDAYIFRELSLSQRGAGPSFDFRLNPPRPKNMRIDPKVVKYLPNGTGRDFYISWVKQLPKRRTRVAQAGLPQWSHGGLPVQNESEGGAR